VSSSPYSPSFLLSYSFVPTYAASFLLLKHPGKPISSQVQQIKNPIPEPEDIKVNNVPSGFVVEFKIARSIHATRSASRKALVPIVKVRVEEIFNTRQDNTLHGVSPDS
jgi:hypothetical protein